MLRITSHVTTFTCSHNKLYLWSACPEVGWWEFEFFEQEMFPSETKNIVVLDSTYNKQCMRWRQFHYIYGFIDIATFYNLDCSLSYYQTKFYFHMAIVWCQQLMCSILYPTNTAYWSILIFIEKVIKTINNQINIAI